MVYICRFVISPTLRFSPISLHDVVCDLLIGWRHHTSSGSKLHSVAASSRGDGILDEQIQESTWFTKGGEWPEARLLRLASCFARQVTAGPERVNEIAEKLASAFPTECALSRWRYRVGEQHKVYLKVSRMIIQSGQR